MSDERYRAQLRVRALGGPAAQERLSGARAAVVGVGATGGAIADSLVRAGVGRVDLIDRDVPELSNLQRQFLYDEEDVRRGLPKAVAAAERLRRVNSTVAVEPVVADLGPRDALSLLGDADVVLDGTDNFQTRFVINDACASLGTPWVYTGVVGTTVHSFPVVPGDGPCFRCYLDRPPAPGAVDTCDTAGVLGPAVLVAAGLAAAEGLKLLAGAAGRCRGLLVLDVWTRESRALGFAPDPDCPTCAGRFEHLEAPGEGDAPLCGRDAVMLRPAGAARLDLGALAARLAELGRLEARSAHLVRFAPSGSDLRITLFADGRAIVKGTTDPARARSLYARYVGT